MLVEITAEGFGVELDIAYATTNNFTGAPVYRRHAAFLLPEAAENLRKACGMARALGLHFRIFDAYRPSEAQWLLWDHTPDPEFLADPHRGSPHSMGAAVDLTLVDSATGQDLDMGTAFDAFTPLSHHAVTDGISAEAQRNRLLLLGIMTAAGFDFYSSEWWHYQLFNARARYPVLTDAASGARMMEP
ncbi:D-alanyl-D-alanine dipeptidase [Novispirillum itersonii]|uniref:D-alanyl-D-alanine dipeptidase n=1 Tax=Novispirillum itersonii TaxID=189 RepID=A0A7X0DQB7_NOVIT|nr:D-alanyl-D-alanine dipeptidase [Novispirillum itersonii]MBB6212102.1 D-alanyl-D-alanine dipeptidase [Novispirillum itersonii]